MSVPYVDSIEDTNIPNKNNYNERDYINNFYKDELFLENKMIESDRTKVVLFALSSYGKQSINTTNINGNNYYYFHQQEPCLIKERITLGKNGLDYAIILMTDDTCNKKAEPIKVKSEKEGIEYWFNISEKEYIQEILEDANILKTGKADIDVSIKNMKNTEVSNNSRIIYISVEDKSEEGIACAISKTIETIRQIGKDGLDIHYYNNGGFREIPTYLETIMSLIKEDPNVYIQKNVIEYKDGTSICKIAGSGVIEFVSGINEFRNYGKIDSLKKYYEGRIDDDSADRDFINCLEKIAYGIQANNISVFQSGLLSLKTIKNDRKTELKDYYLKLFFEEITDDLMFIDKKDVSDAEYVTNMMEWSLEKGYYQQALTMIESFVPILLHQYKKFIYIYPDGFVSHNKRITKQEDECAVFNSAIIICVKGNSDSDKFDGNFIFKNPKNPLADSVRIWASDEMYNLLLKHIELKDKRDKANHVTYKTDMNYSSSELMLKDLIKQYIIRLRTVINREGVELRVSKEQEKNISSFFEVEVTERRLNAKKKDTLRVKFEKDGNEVEGVIPHNVYIANINELQNVQIGDKLKCKSSKNPNNNLYELEFVSIIRNE